MLLGDLVISSFTPKEDYMKDKMKYYSTYDCPIYNVIHHCMRVYGMSCKIMFLKDNTSMGLRNSYRDIIKLPIVFLLIDRNGLVYDLILNYYGIAFEDWCCRSHFKFSVDVTEILSKTVPNARCFKKIHKVIFR